MAAETIGVTTMTDDKPPVERALIRTVGLAIALGILLVGVTIALVIAVIASDQAKAQCQIDKTIAEAPLSAATTQFGLRISAATRVAYGDASCDLGKLKPADPRVAALIRAGIR